MCLRCVSRNIFLVWSLHKMAVKDKDGGRVILSPSGDLLLLLASKPAPPEASPTSLRARGNIDSSEDELVQLWASGQE